MSPRHFAKKMYGPYFPYDHGSKHAPHEQPKTFKSLNFLKIIWSKIKTILKK